MPSLASPACAHVQLSLQSMERALSAPPASAGASLEHLVAAIEAAAGRSAGAQWRCTECGVTSTPQRRLGPQGRQSLCNACGVRYSRLIRQQAQQGAPPAAAPTRTPPSKKRPSQPHADAAAQPLVSAARKLRLHMQRHIQRSCGACL